MFRIHSISHCNARSKHGNVFSRHLIILEDRALGMSGNSLLKPGLHQGLLWLRVDEHSLVLYVVFPLHYLI